MAVHHEQGAGGRDPALRFLQCAGCGHHFLQGVRLQGSVQERASRHLYRFFRRRGHRPRHLHAEGKRRPEQPSGRGLRRQPLVEICIPPVAEQRPARHEVVDPAGQVGHDARLRKDHSGLPGGLLGGFQERPDPHQGRDLWQYGDGRRLGGDHIRQGVPAVAGRNLLQSSDQGRGHILALLERGHWCHSAAGAVADLPAAHHPRSGAADRGPERPLALCG